MAAHRKFTFDDPADSYWNANGPMTVSIFDDVPSTSNAVWLSFIHSNDKLLRSVSLFLKEKHFSN